MHPYFRIIFIAIQLFTGGLLYAQTDEDNHRKYWYYKARLNNDFVKVGLDSGESIPMNTRGRWAKSFEAENVELGSGDATSVLGNYLALLATEFCLLEANRQSTTKVKHEIFCALNAINRLDACAENLWKAGSGTLNGFFIRDDFSSAFLKKPENYAHFNYYNTGLGNHRASRGFMSRLQCGANMINSDLTDNEKRPEHDISMSQDQVYNLLFGLMFVTRFVPVEETDGNNVFGYGSGETSLTKEARNIANRIINFTRNSTDLHGNSCLGDLSTGWTIKNPTTCNEVLRGSDAHIYAYPLAEIQCMINNPNAAAHTRSNGMPYACSQGKENGYHNAYSSSAGYFLWNNVAKTSVYLPSNAHYGAGTRGFNALLASLCNCVYGSVDEFLLNSVLKPMNDVPVMNYVSVGADWGYKLAGSALSSVIPGFYLNITASSISKTAYINGTGKPSNPLGDPGCPFDHAPLVLKVLHGSRYIPNRKYSFKYLLDVAPCDGIYNLNHLNYPHYEWSSDSRIDHPDRRGWYGKNQESKKPFDPDQWRPASGEYNAIDYMLYHNLWYVHELQEGKRVRMEDLSEIDLSSRRGFSQNLRAYETLKINNTRFFNQDSAFWRAGKTIYLGPGTEITGENNLRVYIQKYECALDEGQFSTTMLPEATEGINSPASPVTPHSKPGMDEDGLIVVPSVTEDIIKVFFKLEEKEKGFITVMDLQGKNLISIESITAIDSGLQIDMSAHPSGMYILKLFGTSGNQQQKKFIKR